MILIDNEYKKGYSFPSREINPKEKGESYCCDFTKGIYSKYVGDKSAWPHSQRAHWEMMRLYSKAKQSSDKYKAWFFSDLSAEDGAVDTFDDAIGNSALGRRAKREGWYGMLWDIVSPAPKIMNSIHGMFDDVEYDLYVDVVDAKSKELEEHEKWLKIVQGKFADWQVEYKKRAGIPIDEQVMLPKSEEEFNMMAASEGFKLGIAKSMQKLVRVAVDHDSEWMDVVKKKLIDDFLVVGRAATKDYYDTETKRFKARYVNVVDAVIQYSAEDDFNDSEWGGVFRPWTISNLKLKRPDITEEEWKKVAKKYANISGNPGYSSDWDDPSGGWDPGRKCYEYDSFKVSVFEAEWIDYDTTRALQYKSVYGRETYHRIGYDTEIEDLSEKQKSKGVEQKVKKVVKRRLYECYWVVGTDVVFDYGPVKMAPTDKYYRPTLRLKVESLQQPSIIEQLYPVFDQFMIAWLRHQNSMAKMMERGYAVNVGMLMEITDGTGKKWSWDEIFELWKQTGLLPYMTSVYGDYKGGATSPVAPIDGGLGQRLEESVRTFEWCFWMIENITGINPIALGATPQKDVAVTTTQMSLQATNNSLKPIIYGLMELKKNTAANVLRRIQVGIRNSEEIRKSYTGTIGSPDIEALAQAEHELPRYGMTLKFRPSEKYKDKLREYVQAALGINRNGVSLLDFPEALYFEERIDQGADLMEIRQQIAYAIEKNKQRAFAESQANIQKQNEGLMAVEQQKQQGEAQLQQLGAELDGMKTKGKALWDINKNTTDNNQKLFSDIMLQRPEMADVAMRAAQMMGDMSAGDLSVVMSNLMRQPVPPVQTGSPVGEQPPPLPIEAEKGM